MNLGAAPRIKKLESFVFNPYFIYTLRYAIVDLFVSITYHSFTTAGSHLML